MKRLLAFASAASLLLAAVTPALARERREDSFQLPNINLNINAARVYTGSSVTADTGDNIQGNFVTAYGSPADGVELLNTHDRDHHHDDPADPVINVSGDNTLTTGSAIATSNTSVYVNTYRSAQDEVAALNEDSDHHRHHDESDPTTINANINLADVETVSEVGANTGYNLQGNSVETDASNDVNLSGDNAMTTHDATATSNSLVVVNSEWSPAL